MTEQHRDDEIEVNGYEGGTHAKACISDPRAANRPISSNRKCPGNGNGDGLRDIFLLREKGAWVVDSEALAPR